KLSFATLDRAKYLFEKNGFVVLKEAIPQELITTIHASLLKAVREDQITNKSRDLHLFPDGEISSAHNLADYLVEYIGLIQLSNVRELIGKIYGKLSDAVFNSSYFAKPKLIGLETKPHQDNAFFCMSPPEIATCWIPLSFADTSNGGMYYFVGSHQAGNLPHEPEGNLGASMCINSEHIDAIASRYCKQYISIKAGDCILHNSLVVHGSNENLSEFDRHAFNFSIGSANAVRNEDLFNQYQNKLNEYLKQKKSSDMLNP
ncbi:MAG: phytanoyl-CoA dioxygenase family protein, partial [Burkholderiales bacterium]|nr:phytanoyl-CoA dioxygenase family protein [Burkholderiales bacterium]